MSQRPQLYGQYLSDLVTTLNAGPLNASQSAQLQLVLNQVNGFPKSLIGQAEIGAFRNIAVQSFGYPQNGYRPERFEALSAKDFLTGPGNGLGFKVPNESEVKALLDKIKKACCKK